MRVTPKIRFQLETACINLLIWDRIAPDTRALNLCTSTMQLSAAHRLHSGSGPRRFRTRSRNAFKPEAVLQVKPSKAKEASPLHLQPKVTEHDSRGEDARHMKATSYYEKYLPITIQPVLSTIQGQRMTSWQSSYFNSDLLDQMAEPLGLTIPQFPLGTSLWS